MNVACFDKIIGLTQFNCTACNPGVTYPAGYADSLSGLYLDDLAEMAEIRGLVSCENGTVFEILAAARAEGIKRFIADVSARLASRYNPIRPGFQGAIGESTYKESYTGTAAYGGIRIKPNRIKAGVFKITTIGAINGAISSRNVLIYDNTNTLKATIPITTINGFKKTTLATPIELPLYDAMNPSLEYFIVYDPDGSKVNKLWCNCNSWNPRWCLTDPYYNYPVPGMDYQWAKWLMAGSYETEDLTTFNDAAESADNLGYGLSIEGKLYCNAGEAICKGALTFDNSDPMDWSKAFAIRYAAADSLIQQLCMTTKLSRTAVINREALQAIRPEIEGKYREHVDYVADNVSLAATDCLGCKGAMEVSVGKTFA